MFAADTTQNLVLNTAWAGLAVSTVIPLVVALLTKVNASSQIKALVNLLLTALTAALTELIDNGGSLPIDQFLGAFGACLLASQVLGHRLLFSHGAEQQIQA